MPTTYTTPGIYIEEQNAFPNSVVAVETAVPVFIGYTQKAERNGKNLEYIPTRISSVSEYVQLFGKGYSSKFKLLPDAANPPAPEFIVNGKAYTLVPGHTLYFYNSIRLFYQNGGRNCYILSVGTYGDSSNAINVQYSDFTGGDEAKDVFKILEKESEPTIVVIPDIISKPAEAYQLYAESLLHCKRMQSRFGIFDVMQSGKTPVEDIQEFRDAIGTEALNYGAAYYPFLNTSIVSATEIDFNYFDESVDLVQLLPEDKIKLKAIFTNNKKLQDEHNAKQATATAEWLQADQRSIDAKHHEALLAFSPSYKQLIEAITTKLNLIPPSAAIAGIYTLVDDTNGVWKAPANISLAAVISPSINISPQLQENMNVDATSGKSVNAIRSFPGQGVLVWGARTLDGNSLDWRYINVRRTMIMIEQSLKLATRSFVFEPNDANTWVKLQAMSENFLFNLWKMGALQGNKPEEAYNVQVGLGKTMTANDIHDGVLRVTVMVAMLRPAEFIVISFQQKMQQS